MKLLKKMRTFSLTATAIRACGLLFLAAGMFGYMMQVNVLGAVGTSNTELFNALQADSSLMVSATLSVVGQALEACAVPIFAFLLVEGSSHTSNFTKYFLRVLGLAAVSQLSYNLLIAGSLLKFYRLNPVFAAVLSMVMLYFFRRFPGKKMGHIAMKCCAFLFAFLWSNMLGVSHGAACVIVTAVLWGFREKPNLRMTFGVLVTLGCVVFSMFYMVAPISCLLIYFYSGEQGSHNRIINYMVYPVLLLICGLMSMFG